MAGKGSANGACDFSFAPGTNCATTIAQYMIVCGGTGSSNFTPEVPQTTTAYNFIVGIQQSRCTAGSVSMDVRLLGVSKLWIYDTTTAFNWIRVGTSGYGYNTVPGQSNATSTTIQTLCQVAMGIIGQALESGNTGQAIEVIVRPFYCAYGLLAA